MSALMLHAVSETKQDAAFDTPDEDLKVSVLPAFFKILNCVSSVEDVRCRAAHFSPKSASASLERIKNAMIDQRLRDKVLLRSAFESIQLDSPQVP